MSKNIGIMTPVGRLVQGSLYDPDDKDANGRPLMYKTGPKAGQPRVNFYFAIAIPKGTETHWNQTDWGKLIYQTGIDNYPNGQWQRPDFAWKIGDGDSTIPNTEGRRPCDYEGFAKNWILKTSGSFAPKLYNRYGSQQLSADIKIERGYFIQAYLNVASNKSDQKPGLYLNHSIVAFSEYGDIIVSGPDASSLGFGQAPLPVGARAVPAAAFVAPVDVATPPPAPAPAPYPEILNAPARVLLPAANGLTYEQYKQAGWTDEQMIQNGIMAP